MTEVDNIIRVENHNLCVKMCEKSKIRYESECKKMDDLLIQYHQLDNLDEKNNLLGHFFSLQGNINSLYFAMMSEIRQNGDKVYDPSMLKKRRFSLINEELIQKTMSPARLARHLELGGDIEDF